MANAVLGLWCVMWWCGVIEWVPSATTQPSFSPETKLSLRKTRSQNDATCCVSLFCHRETVWTANPACVGVGATAVYREKGFGNSTTLSLSPQKKEEWTAAAGAQNEHTLLCRPQVYKNTHPGYSSPEYSIPMALSSDCNLS